MDIDFYVIAKGNIYDCHDVIKCYFNKIGCGYSQT